MQATHFKENKDVEVGYLSKGVSVVASNHEESPHMLIY